MSKASYIGDLEKWQADFSFSIIVKIRFSETDMFGHVNNVSPFIYFEEARIEFLKSLGLFGDVNNGEGIPIVADLQCDYHRQMFFNEEIELFVKANHVGNTSFDVHYMALNGDEKMCLTGRGRMVYVNPADGKPVPLSEKMKNLLMNK